MRKPKGLASIKSLVVLAVIILLIAILLPMVGISHPKMSVINNGPLDIRLVGVRPDGGRYIYDPNGKKTEKSLISYTTYAQSWKPESQYREFIFEVPKVEDQLLFTVFQKLKVSDNNRPLGGGFRSMFDQTKVPSTLVYSITFKRTYNDRFFFLTFKKPIRYVDFTLRYFYGPRAHAICTFTGPFALNKTYKADQNLPYEAIFQETYSLIGTGIEMRFVTMKPFDSDTPVIMYDLQGMRYLLRSGSGHSGSGGADRKYRDIPLSLDEIAAVTFGERPYEITFKNIKVHYPNLPVRTHPEYLDIMAERLNLSSRTPEQLSRYKFKDPQEAIKVMDIVRDASHIGKVVEAIKYGKPKIHISELDQPTQDKIRKIANEWASDKYLESAGIMIGLQGKWPEFFDLAIERLGKNPPQNQGYPYDERYWRQSNHQITNTMVNYRLNELTPGRVEKLKQLILNTDDSGLLHDLFLYLNWTKSQETTDALRELAQNEKPWIWWPALKAWYPRVANNKKMLEELPENIKRRLTLVQNNMYEDTLDDESKKLLKDIFTPEFSILSRTHWNEACRRISGQFDRKTATEIYINYLRRMQSGITSRQWIADKSGYVNCVTNIIRILNVWYDTNIGNLGIEETRSLGSQKPRTFTEFQSLLTEAIEWNENNSDAEPLKPGFAGKVIDTAGNPVAGAELILSRFEYYQNDRGGRSQRKVEFAKRLSGDDGSFSFDEVANDNPYFLDVTADGFLAKEELFIQRLDDGRYRYQGYNEPADNVITMQRPGKINGTVIGTDGQPLADTRLKLFANVRYSHAPRDRNITTDSQGKFTKDDMAAEPAILSYTRYWRVQQERRPRLEYDGLCGALIIENKEGQEISGIVLDLSTSVCSIEIQVVDDVNQPVDDLTFTFDAEMHDGSYQYASIFSVKMTSIDGVYRFDGLPDGKWRMRINNREYLTKLVDIELSPRQTARYKMQFDASSLRARFQMEQEAAAEKQSQQTKEIVAIDSDSIDDTDEMEGFSETEKAEFEKHIALLKLRWNIKNERKEDVNEAIAKLAAMGDKVIKPIVEDFNRHGQSTSFRSDAILVFEGIKTKMSRETLLSIALGTSEQRIDTLRRFAARRYIKILEDKSEIKKLLVSQDLGVLEFALKAMKGQPIDKVLLNRLTEILGKEEPGLNEFTLQRNAASVIAEDPTSTYAGEKVLLIITAIKSVHKIPKADELYPRSYGTYAEMMYFRYIEALSKIKGADSYLRYHTPRVSDQTLYCVLIARSRRGDESVKSGLVKILQDKSAGMFRAWSALCFGDIGTQDDILFLQKIVESDPLERKLTERPNKPSFFPVRIAAENSIKLIEERAK